MRIVLGCALALLAGCKVHHHAAPDPRPPTVKEITLQYPSGLRVVFEQHPGSGRVAIAALVGAGGNDDPQGREGTAHFLEHLAFRSRPSGRLSMWDELDFAGVASSESAAANGTTTYESTIYSGTTPKDRVTSVLPLFASMVVQPLLGVDEQTLELERAVVRDEHLQKDPHGGGEVIEAVTLSVFGPGTPGAGRVIGGHESIAAITRADVEAFATAHYRPEATTVVMVGDLEPEQIDSMIRASFPASWLSSAGKTVAPLQLDRRPMELTRPAPRSPKPVIVAAAFTRMLIFSWLAPGTTEPGGAAIERFGEAMRDELEYVVRARGGEIVSVEVLRGPVRSILMMQVALKPGADEDDLVEVLRIHQSFGDVSFDELTNTTMSSLYRDQNLQQHAENRARDIFATGSTKPVPMGDVAERRALERFRDELLTWDNARIVRVRTLVKPTVQLHDLPPKLEGPPRRLVVPPEMVKSVSLPPPLPEVKRFTLENGLQVVLSRRTPVPLVTVTLGLPAGARHARYGVSDFIGALLQWQRPARWMERLPSPILEVRPDITLLRLNHAAWNLPALLDLLSHNLRPEVNFSPKWATQDLVEFMEHELAKQREMEENKKARWKPARSSLLEQVVAPRSSLMAFPVEDAKKLTHEDFMRFVDLAFRPNGAVLMIDGEHDLEATERWVREIFTGWQPSAVKLPPLRNPGPVPGRQELPDVLEGPAAITELRLMCRLPPAKTLEQRGGLALLEEALALSFEDDLRRARGLTYGVNVNSTDYRNEDNVLLLRATLDARADQEALSLFMDRLHELEGAVWDEQLVDLARWRVAKRYMGSVATSPSVSRLFVGELTSGASFEETLTLPLRLSSTPLKYVDEAWAACSDTMAMQLEGDIAGIWKVLSPGDLHESVLKRVHD